METRAVSRRSLARLLVHYAAAMLMGLPHSHVPWRHVQFEEDGASDASSVNGGALLSSRRAMTSLARRVDCRVARSTGFSVCIRAPEAISVCVCALAIPLWVPHARRSALAPDHLVRAEWLPPPGAPQSLPSQARGSAQAEVRS